MPSFDVVAGFDTAELNAAIATFYHTVYPNLLKNEINIGELGIASVGFDVKAPPTAELVPSLAARAHIEGLLAAPTGQLAPVAEAPPETRTAIIDAAAQATFSLSIPQLELTINYTDGNPPTVIEAAATVELGIGTETSSGHNFLTLIAIAGSVSIPADPDLAAIINNGAINTLLDYLNTQVLTPLTIPALQYNSLTVSVPVPVVQEGYALAFSALGLAPPDIPGPVAWPHNTLFFAADGALLTAAANTVLPIGPSDSFNWTIVSGSVGATVGPVDPGGVTINGDGSLNARVPCNAEAELTVDLPWPLPNITFGASATVNLAATATASVNAGELSFTLDSIAPPTFDFTFDGLPSWISEFLGLDALADALGAVLAPLITQIVKGLTFPVLSIPSEEITLNGSTYTLSVSQVNISAIQGPQGELLLVTCQPTFVAG
jgi:hypothetical protein